MGFKLIFFLVLLLIVIKSKDAHIEDSQEGTVYIDEENGIVDNDFSLSSTSSDSSSLSASSGMAGNNYYSGPSSKQISKPAYRPKRNISRRHSSYSAQRQEKSIVPVSSSEPTPQHAVPKPIAPSASRSNQSHSVIRKEDLKCTRVNMLRAFVFNELMQKHDINKIYERIPGIRNDE